MTLQRSSGGTGNGEIAVTKQTQFMSSIRAAGLDACGTIDANRIGRQSASTAVTATIFVSPEGDMGDPAPSVTYDGVIYYDEGDAQGGEWQGG